MALMPGLFKKGRIAGDKKSDADVATKGDADITQAAQPDDAQKAQAARQMAEMRHRIHLALGQIVVALSMVPRYRHLSLADMQTFVIDPLMRERIALALAGSVEPGAQPDGPMVGLTIWATVSNEVDAKIREQINAGVFPVRLKPEDWTSGGNIWLLDVVAPTQKLASSLLANFRQVVKEGDVRIHPIVARVVDPELLQKLGATQNATAN